MRIDNPDSLEPNLAVIIVNYNGSDDTIRAYRSLSTSTYMLWVAYVIDNASGDNSLEVLRKEIKQGSLIESKTNLGFAGACNLAFEYAKNMGLQYVFLLNNDAILAPNCLEKLIIASATLGDQAILGCVTKYDGTDDYQFIGSKTDVKSGLPAWSTPDSLLVACDLIESDFVYGAAMFIPLKVIRTVGTFDEKFFLNYEESDFCYRARKMAVRSFVLPQAVAHHRAGASLGTADGPLQCYFLTRNELLFVEKHASTFQQLRVYGRWFKKACSIVWRRFVFRTGKITTAEKAILLGLRDYGLRRFGDCPHIVRKYAAERPREDQTTRHIEKRSRN